MNKKVKNIINNKYFIIVLIILLMTLVIGTGTYAWLTWSSQSSTNMTVTIGNIADVIFNNGKEINTTNLAPVFTSDQGEKTNFSIVKRNNAQSTNISYTVTLNITSIASELKTSSFKYVLLNKNTNTVVSTGDLSTATNGSTITLYSSILSGTRIDYDFIIYIDGNEENNTNMMNKTFKASLNVNASVITAADPTVADPIIELYNNATKILVPNNNINYQYDTTNSLMVDTAGNIRYYGASPNNYIYFNCETYPDTNCETWRIIGVFDGKLKIMRNESIGELAWDQDKNIDSSKTTYDNDWSTASLKVLLNEEYYNGDTAGTVTYYSDSTGGTSTSLNMANIGIKNDTTRNMIAEVTWNLGGWNNSAAYSDTIYEKERGTAVYTGRPTTWTGKIALAYPSDYGYAADLSKCIDKQLIKYSDSTCTANNWMKTITSTNFAWLLTPSSTHSFGTWLIISSGSVVPSVFGNGNFGAVFNTRMTMPTLYLDSNLSIASGDGSSSNPYKLSA